ncbi:tRNA 2-thiocytidine biosynthesis TtcA family protein [Alkalibacter mobilis]|uniref:tRNA 2-thiocytidine biosynthesis TtcA family protein n=1 Tax=Alkalibacter mobilis TaxID=2787712 RepID=UPI00189E87A6|nr:tRNA 2-thiocytidine biosynthesis protein TtcA [Alkalibacter mobilis]
MEKHQLVERSIIKKYRKEIWNRFIKGVIRYDLISEGDKIAVCISGGKDSMLMAKAMQILQKHGKYDFELVFLVMDPGYNSINRQVIENNAKILEVPLTIFESQIYDIVADMNQSPCYLCAKMRRGHLYAKAKELGCNKIALGHHFDDVIETTLMSMLYSAEIKTMMPKLKSSNFEGMELIRPLYMVREDDIIAWRRYNELEFIRCACRLTEKCVLGDDGIGSKRQEMKALIKKLNKNHPGIDMNIFTSMHNVNLDTVIEYRKHGEKHSFLEEYDI